MQEDKNVNKKGFLKGMRAELKKVIWPTFNQTMKSTFVTIVFVLIISTILIVLNLVFGELNRLWIDSITRQDTIIRDNKTDIMSGDNLLSGDSNVDVSGDISEEIISGDIISGE